MVSQRRGETTRPACAVRVQSRAGSRGGGRAEATGSGAHSSHAVPERSVSAPVCQVGAPTMRPAQHRGVGSDMHHNQRPWSCQRRRQQAGRARPGGQMGGRIVSGGAHHRRRRRPRRLGLRCRRPRGQSPPRCSPQPSQCCQWWWSRPGQPPWTERPRARPSEQRGAPPQGRRPPGTSWIARRTACV